MFFSSFLDTGQARCTIRGRKRNMVLVSCQIQATQPPLLHKSQAWTISDNTHLKLAEGKTLRESEGRSTGTTWSEARICPVISRTEPGLIRVFCRGKLLNPAKFRKAEPTPWTSGSFSSQVFKTANQPCRIQTTPS